VKTDNDAYQMLCAADGHVRIPCIVPAMFPSTKPINKAILFLVVCVPILLILIIG
jgi:hypothetical protein